MDWRPIYTSNEEDDFLTVRKKLQTLWQPRQEKFIPSFWCLYSWEEHADVLLSSLPIIRRSIRDHISAIHGGGYFGDRDCSSLNPFSIEQRFLPWSTNRWNRKQRKGTRQEHMVSFLQKAVTQIKCMMKHINARSIPNRTAIWQKGSQRNSVIKRFKYCWKLSQWW